MEKVVAIEVSGEKTFAVGDAVTREVFAYCPGDNKRTLTIPGVVVLAQGGLYVVATPHLGILDVIGHAAALTLVERGGSVAAANALVVTAEKMRLLEKRPR